ncbi:hypothetical protein L198_06255 [Cryptococcus wingfieldii CBS 7118]|uniref:Alpha N-terminal protein methyltransferase 1 n=1 Tax=Cryptococcus wingfieldii CBS 7118 TaxID=1295528 RepID=A0A1E3INQ4_9TREE|nr:hypothetical protein L198_06255 [Cryptococcus wingfieldii CBS 7118]ODN90237.1 hypothetical protein L198_06255 [Cryptococcus wingfieldii CBS 7118]
MPLPDAKRHKPNSKPSLPTPAPPSSLGSALKNKASMDSRPGPDYERGIEYWDNVEASVDGVLGGFGTGPVPHIEQLSSRLLLLSLLPSLSPFPSPLTPAPLPPLPVHRRTALDVGAGIGRVTRTVLAPLFDDVVLVEPVGKFVGEAYRSASDGEWRDLPLPVHALPPKPVEREGNELQVESYAEAHRQASEAKGGRGKRVRFIQGGLQLLDPRSPGKNGVELGVVGQKRGGGEGLDGEEVVYDVIWCQWCHMNHDDLVSFLQRSRAALRSPDSYIFVKENCCDEGANGEPQEFMDEEDSSLTRSSGKWVEAFKDAGLRVVKEEVQEGMPEELFVVKTWALQ